MRTITTSSIWRSYPGATVVVLLLGYFVLGLSIGGGSVWLGLHYFGAYQGPFHHWILFIFFFGSGAAILVSLVPRPIVIKIEGLEIKPQEQPRLFELVHNLATRIGQRMPDEIYLVPALNAGIAMRGGIRGFGGRRIMEVGLPLLHVLNVSQFEGVLAHEFGHHHGRNGRLCRWLDAVQHTIDDTVDILSLGLKRNSLWLILYILRLPFVLYGNLCIHVREAASRIQEISADRFAAETVGSHAYAGLIHALEENGIPYGDYFDSEVRPVLRSGYVPPLMEGYALYLQSGWKQPARLSDPYDVHPEHYERLAAIEDIRSEQTEDDSPASSLLNGVAELERQVLSSSTPRHWPKDLKPIPWKEVGRCALVPYWREQCKLNTPAIRDLTLSSLPSTMSAIDEFAKSTRVCNFPADAARYFAQEILVAALSLALYGEGWQIDHSPGSLLLRSGDAKIDPRHLFEEMQQPEFTEDNWNRALTTFNLDARLSLAARAG